MINQMINLKPKEHTLSNLIDYIRNDSSLVITCTSELFFICPYIFFKEKEGRYDQNQQTFHC